MIIDATRQTSGLINIPDNTTRRLPSAIQDTLIAELAKESNKKLQGLRELLDDMIEEMNKISIDLTFYYVMSRTLDSRKMKANDANRYVVTIAFYADDIKSENKYTIEGLRLELVDTGVLKDYQIISDEAVREILIRLLTGTQSLRQSFKKQYSE